MKKLWMVSLLLIAGEAHAFNTTQQHCDLLQSYTETVVSLKKRRLSKTDIVRAFFKEVAATNRVTQAKAFDVAPYVMTNIDLLFDRNLPDMSATIANNSAQICKGAIGKESQ